VRHVKNGDGIDPLGVGPVIPELPKKTADVSGGEKHNAPPEITFLPVTKDGGAAQPVIDRIDQEK
jgi:hypothetical protein